MSAILAAGVAVTKPNKATKEAPKQEQPEAKKSAKVDKK